MHAIGTKLYKHEHIWGTVVAHGTTELIKNQDGRFVWNDNYVPCPAFEVGDTLVRGHERYTIIGVHHDGRPLCKGMPGFAGAYPYRPNEWTVEKKVNIERNKLYVLDGSYVEFTSDTEFVNVETGATGIMSAIGKPVLAKDEPRVERAAKAIRGADYPDSSWWGTTFDNRQYQRSRARLALNA